MANISSRLFLAPRFARSAGKRHSSRSGVGARRSANLNRIVAAFFLLYGCSDSAAGDLTVNGVVDQDVDGATLADGNAAEILQIDTQVSDIASDSATIDGAQASSDAQADGAGETAPDSAQPPADAALGCGQPCDDKNPCTDDYCDTAIGKCKSFNNASACDDGEACTGGDKCAGGICVAGSALCAKLLPQGMGESPCKLEGDLPQASTIQLIPWFTTLALKQPIQLLTLPDGSDKMVAVQRPGTIRVFDNNKDVATSTLVLDISKNVYTAGEGGLLSAAFHPKFKQNRKVYVSYTQAPVPVVSTILEFVLDANNVAILSTQRVVFQLQQPTYTNHKGGQIYFDNSGMLLLGFGDGGSANDPNGNGQNNKTMLAKMLRIDVDHKDAGKEYAIPKDNPFVNNPAYLPEIFATGLRNPWRFSVDRLTGQIWTGDVGQDKWEEVDIVEKGKNYGWNTMEATHCFKPKVDCDQTGLTMPIVEYSHTVGVSITGGYVYRGSQQKSLYGAYIFADYNDGLFFSVTKNGAAYKLTQLLKAPVSPVAFGEDRDGELYVVQLFGAAGTVFKIVETKSTPPPGPAFPLTLMATKCFPDLQNLIPAPGMLQYEVNSPLWSDGATKKRWLVLPKSIVLPNQPGPVLLPDDDNAAWQLPVGTLIVKHFGLGDGGKTPVETRFARRDADAWSYYSYRWRKDGTDADLQLGGGGQVDWNITKNALPSVQTWHYPTSSQCVLCHKAAGSIAEQALGLRTTQINRAAQWGPLTSNQLTVFSQGGLFKQLNVQAKAHGAQFPVDLTQPVAAGNLEATARSWLASNCASCHRPQGAAPSDMDLRWAVPLSATATCNLPPQNGNVDGKATAIIAPGQPDKSALWLRLNAKPDDGWFMPQIAVSIAQPGVTEMLSAWIKSLKCP